MSEPTAAEEAMLADRLLDSQIDAWYEAKYQEREFGPQPDDPPPDDVEYEDVGLEDWFGALTPEQQEEALDRYAQHLEKEVTEKILRRHDLIEAPPEPRPDPRSHPRLETE